MEFSLFTDGLAILIAELWLGVCVPGLTLEQPYIERSKQPGPYWFMIILETSAVIVIAILAWLSGSELQL